MIVARDILRIGDAIDLLQPQRDAVFHFSVKKAGLFGLFGLKLKGEWRDSEGNVIKSSLVGPANDAIISDFNRSGAQARSKGK